MPTLSYCDCYIVIVMYCCIPTYSTYISDFNLIFTLAYIYQNFCYDMNFIYECVYEETCIRSFMRPRSKCCKMFYVYIHSIKLEARRLSISSVALSLFQTSNSWAKVYYLTLAFCLPLSLYLYFSLFSDSLLPLPSFYLSHSLAVCFWLSPLSPPTSLFSFNHLLLLLYLHLDLNHLWYPWLEQGHFLVPLVPYPSSTTLSNPNPINLDWFTLL